ncbi:MAG: 2-amino-4-hydroxy-6-hydroxymethyldihydropteridine diphosphokinase [bacterium]
MIKAYLGIGSNLGNREKHFEEAIHRLAGLQKIELLRKSAIVETEPIGYREQPVFLNSVLEISTSLKPFELLDVALQTEQRMGRKRRVTWGPRTIDIDILLYAKEQINTKKITVPHPRLHERKFVLVPLTELIPDFNVPGFGKNVRTLLNCCQDQSLVLPYAPLQINWEPSISKS